MSDIRFHCPRCDGHLVVDGRGAGMSLPCPHCGADVPIPDGAVEPVHAEASAGAGLHIAARAGPPPLPGPSVASALQTAGVACMPTAAPGRFAPRPLVRERAPGALASVLWGVAGMFICGLILGVVAISKANEARKLVAMSPEQYTGDGLATVGLVIGILDIVGWAVVLVLRLIGMGGY